MSETQSKGKNVTFSKWIAHLETIYQSFLLFYLSAFQ